MNKIKFKKISSFGLSELKLGYSIKEKHFKFKHNKEIITMRLIFPYFISNVRPIIKYDIG